MPIQQLFFIDAQVADIDRLISGLPAGSQWYVLNPELDGVRQMQEIAAGYSNLNSIQIISHGSAGSLALGSSTLTNQNISGYRTELGTLGASLNNTSDILLYGCNVGAGAVGQQFINQLAQFTGADVAASDDVTGASNLAGDWLLEATTGSIDTSALTVPDYAYVLPSTTNTRSFPGHTLGEFRNNRAFAAIRIDGSVVTWGNSSFGGNSSGVAAQINGAIDVTQIFSTQNSFAALRADGAVVTWGNGYYGGDSSGVAARLDGTIDVTQIFSTMHAFAALRADGSVVTWGHSEYGGDSSAVAAQLNGAIDVTQIYSTDQAFAAVRADGSVVTWGNGYYGGDSSGVVAQINGAIDVTQIFVASFAFAALRADGSVVTWGESNWGGDSSAVAAQLNGAIDVTQIYSTDQAFAAVRTDGSVVTWGDSDWGGNSSGVAAQINGAIDVTHICSTQSAFAALRVDGSVVTWGTSVDGGNSSGVAAQLDGTIDVTQVFSTGVAFAALRADGLVVTWGDSAYGGNSSGVAAQINGAIDVTRIFSTYGAFAALRADGSVVTWGDSIFGGDSSGVAAQLNGAIDVTHIYSTGGAFAALRVDGSVVTWGNNDWGGNSSAVASQLSSGVVNISDIYTDNIINNAPSVISISTTTANSVRNEGNSGTNAYTFTVNRTSATGAATVGYTVVGAADTLAGNHTAAVATDFVGGVLPTGTISFAAGQLSRTITVNVAGDTTVEGNERFNVNLTTVTGGTLSSTARSSYGYINNDDVAPSVISISTTTATSIRNEGNAGTNAYSFTVNRTSAVGAATVGYTVVGAADTLAGNHTAASATDFVGGVLPTGTINFAAGQLSQTITVNVAGDTTVEGNERFNVNLTTATGGTLSSTARSSYGYINNDDVAPSVISISTTAANSIKNEGNAGTNAYTFTVNRTNSVGAATVGYTVVGAADTLAGNHTAASATDFVGGVLPTGTISFAAGQLSRTITVNVAGDTTVEGNERFNVVLSNPTNGILSTSNSSSFGYINNDEQAGNAGNTIATARNIGALTATTQTFTGQVGRAGSSNIFTSILSHLILVGNDFYRFTIDSTSNLRVNLTGLAANANVVIYAANGTTVLGTGANTGITNEAIAINNLVAGTYYARVYPGATGAQTNYSLSLAAQVPSSNGADDVQTSSASGVIPSTSQTLAISLTAPTTTDTGTVLVEGLVSRSTASNNQFNIAYVIDRSGSMSSTFSGTETVTDANGNGSANELIDAAIRSFEALTTSLAGSGFSSSRLGIIEFGNSTSAEASILYNNTLSRDANANGILDANESLRTLIADGMTPYDLGLQQAINFFQAAPTGNNVVFFISDGYPNGGAYQDEVATLLNANGINASIRAIGLGAGASLSDLDLVDDGLANNTATRVNTPSTLTSDLVAPPINSADIARVEILREGVVVATILPNQLVSTPLGLRYSASISGLNLADNSLVARVVATDPAHTNVSTGLNVGTGEFNYFIYGGSGNDTLYGRRGTDLLDGGSGTDTASYELNRQAVTVNLSNTDYQDTLGAGLDKLVSIENLLGSAFNDTLTGNSGTNILNGGAGADRMSGGAGNDTYVVDNAGDIITEVASAGTDNVSSSITYTLGANLENLTLTGTGNINGTGNSLANIITGNAGTNILNGRAGADRMSGGAGNDTYVVDNTGDIITEVASAGTDRVNSSITYTLAANLENLTLTGTVNINGTGNDLANIITGNTGTNILTGGAGNDTLNGSSGADQMLGGTGDDIYYLDNIGDSITEAVSAGTDRVNSSITYTLAANLENLTLSGTVNINGTGNDLANRITGNTGNNILTGGAGADQLRGGIGNDTYYVDNIGDVITEAVSAGTDSVNSSITYTLGANLENLTLTGTVNINGTGNDLANTITGNTGTNILTGGAGNDSLNGSSGADQMLGGTGDDIYYLDNTGDLITEAVSAGTDSVNSSITYTLAANLENLTLTGTSVINGTGNDLANIITGNAGNNILTGGAGADQLHGGIGNDTYYVDNIGDLITEAASAGADRIYSSISYTLGANLENLTLTGTVNINGTGNDLANTITGNTGTNILTGGAGNDSLNGSSGADQMLGGTGDDIYYLDNTGDSITEVASAGTDRVNSSITYTLAANLENLTLTGTSTINGTGNDLANIITGNTGNNILTGGAGNDSLNGGLGNDTLTGAAGADTFRFVTTANSGIDTITDFQSGTDKIQVVSPNFANIPVGNLAADRLVAAGTTLTNANAVFIYNGTTGGLSFDRDGNGSAAAVHFATLTGHPTLRATDFQVVAA